MRNKRKKYFYLEITIIIGWLCIGLGTIKVFLEMKTDVEKSEIETEYEYGKTEGIVEEKREKNEVSAVENGLEVEKLTLPYQELSYTYAITSINSSTRWSYDVTDDEMDDIPLFRLEFENKPKKEERINELIFFHCFEVLPAEPLWIEYVEMEIIYSSNKYFCFRYIENGYLPVDYDATQLYVLVDIENEKIIDYPQWKEGTEEVEDEQEDYWSKTVEVQSALRGDTSYKLQESVMDYEGVSFQCVQVEGMEYTFIQNDVNEILTEPMKAIIEMGDEWCLKNMKIYIAYKSEKWLSVVYSFKTHPFEKRARDEFSDLGVTINMETGERYMLDELIDIEGILSYLCTRNGADDEEQLQERLLGCVYTEEELAAHNEGAVYMYGRNWYSYYLYQGEVIFLRCYSFNDEEMLLPEISQYLKVDPWYE